MKIKTSELTGEALNWAVAECQGYFDKKSKNGLTVGRLYGCAVWVAPHPNAWRRNDYTRFTPSTDWAQGGPIIEKEYIGFLPDCGKFWAVYSCGPMVGQRWYGPTPLIAAMRCYVASKLGDEVDVPEKVWGI